MVALLVHALEAQPLLPQRLSEEAVLSLLTTGPSEREIAAAFGHSGIRIQDPEQGLDLLFNYGVFDFEASGFFLNYIRGDLNYRMGLFDSRSYIAHTKEEGRSMLSQSLDLSYEARQSIYSYLLYNYAPERRVFAYDYFYRNCATQIRDLFEQQLPDLVFDTTYVSEWPKGATIRLLMNEQMAHFPWFSLGINLLLGSEVDESIDARAYMFLPKYVASGLQVAELKGDSTQRLVKDEVLLLSDRQPGVAPLNTPLIFCSLMLALVFFITYRDYRAGRSRDWIDSVALSFVGGMGLLMLWLWVGTRHHSTWNYHLLWAWPTHLFVPLLLRVPKLRRLLRIYLKVYGGMLLLLLLGWGLVPQEVPEAVLPVWILLLLRVVHYFHMPDAT